MKITSTGKMVGLDATQMRPAERIEAKMTVFVIADNAGKYFGSKGFVEAFDESAGVWKVRLKDGKL